MNKIEVTEPTSNNLLFPAIQSGDLIASGRFCVPSTQCGYSPPAALLGAHPVPLGPFQGAESLITDTNDRQQ